jgi:antirestriction protein ArdC
MPAPTSFQQPEAYYSTLFHELTHSTGHVSRLNRPTLVDLCPFGSTNYSKEELVAEMGAAFLCGHTGISNTTIDNSAAYIASWLTRLQQDVTLVVHAAAQAQKAVDFILNTAADAPLAPQEEA